MDETTTAFAEMTPNGSDDYVDKQTINNQNTEKKDTCEEKRVEFAIKPPKNSVLIHRKGKNMGNFLSLVN